jgi:hypothetical protein
VQSGEEGRKDMHAVAALGRTEGRIICRKEGLREGRTIGRKDCKEGRKDYVKEKRRTDGRKGLYEGRQDYR